MLMCHSLFSDVANFSNKCVNAVLGISDVPLFYRVGGFSDCETLNPSLGPGSVVSSAVSSADVLGLLDVQFPSSFG